MTDPVKSRAEAIERALLEAHDPYEPGAVFICHGPERCEEKTMPCPWCHVVQHGDKRTVAQIERDLDAQARGH